MRANNFPITFCSWLAVTFSLPAFCQPYVFTRIVDDNTQRPDGKGTFNISGSPSVPSFDGQWIVFREYGPVNDQSAQAIWSFNIVDSTFHKLADLSTPVPGGTGNFKDLQLQDSAPVVRNGIVVFVGRDSNPNRTNVAGGLYAIPAAGGPITRLADYTTADPSGGTFAVIDSGSRPMGPFSFDGKTVAFQATGSTGHTGSYTVNVDGSSLAMVADDLHPYKPSPTPPLLQEVMHFFGPQISGNNVIMFGTTGLDPSTGYNGLYLGSVGGNGSVSEQLNSNQQLPANTNGNFHTRYLYPVLGLEGSQVVFDADDSNSPLTAGGYNGLYMTTLGSHAITKITDMNDPLPGMGVPLNIATYGISMSQGRVLFRAVGNTIPGYPANTALFLWQNGAISRVIGTADPLEGSTVYTLLDPGQAAMSGASFAFNACCASIYLATPPSSGMSIAGVTNSASGNSSSIAPGEVVTLYGKGLGPASLPTFQLDSNNRIPTQLAGVRILFNGIPAPLLYVSDGQAAAIVPTEVGSAFVNRPIDAKSTAEIEVVNRGSVSAPITIPLTDTRPGLFSADQSGSGQGAIQNGDSSINSASNPAAAGSTIVLYGSGFGRIAPAVPDGGVIPTTNIPRLFFPVTVTIGGLPAQVVYQGPAPGAIYGLYQLNCVIPPGVPPGNAAVVATINGLPTQPNLTVAVK
ncbi:MAG TPA: hypothetical protein VGZ73_03235 [Bryobacteraceae bacterium]|nr:hypothetical protein [Bryobacteraceae bacterium]